jgi:hypothetical protein
VRCISIFIFLLHGLPHVSLVRLPYPILNPLHILCLTNLSQARPLHPTSNPRPPPHNKLNKRLHNLLGPLPLRRQRRPTPAPPSLDKHSQRTPPFVSPSAHLSRAHQLTIPPNRPSQSPTTPPSATSTSAARRARQSPSSPSHPSPAWPSCSSSCTSPASTPCLFHPFSSSLARLGSLARRLCGGRVWVLWGGNYRREMD